MNGNPPRQSVTSPLNHAANVPPPGSPTAALLPNVAASLRSALMHNHNVLSQAISQLEAAGDIQNELVVARAAHAQASKDLRVALDQKAAQGLQLQQTQNNLTLVTQKLHGAREQLKLVENRLANVDGQTTPRHAVQDIGSKSLVEGFNSALNSANQQIVELTKKLQLATSAAVVAQTSDIKLPDVGLLTVASSRAQDLEKQLASALGLSDEDSRMATAQPAITALESSSDGTSKLGKANKLQMLGLFRVLRGELDSVVNMAQAFALRNEALEAILATIRELRIEATPPGRQSSTQPSAQFNVPIVQRSPIEADIEMDVERTEAARAARQVNVPPTQTQPPTLSQPVRQFSAGVQSPIALGSAPPTPSQSTFPAQSEAPLRKRQRTSMTAASPEPLPRDDMLHAFVRLVNTTYEIKSTEGAQNEEGLQGGQKRLVCKMCEARHKEQHEHPITSFPYDQNTPITVPPLVNAEPTRALVRPWVDHIQQRHQKIYNHVLGNFERMKAKMATATPRQ